MAEDHRSMEYLYLFIVLALIAEVLGTIGGFGSSLFFVPIAGFFLDFHSVLGITAVFHVASNITKIAMFSKGINWNILIYLGVPAVLCVIIGAFLSQYVDSEMLELVLSIFLILLSIILLVKEYRIEPSKLNSIVGGVLSGGIAGLVGTGGAIRGITLTAFGLGTSAFIATSALIDLGVDSSRAVVYWMNGFVHEHDLYLIPILVGVSIIGTYIGKLILKKVPEQKFRKIVLTMVFITGVSTLIKVMI